MAGRLVRRSWAVFFGLGGAATWLGCNALAGIELGTLAPVDGGANGPDSTMAIEGGAVEDAHGSGEAAPPSSDGSSDGGAEASAPTFTCAGSASPFMVANLETSTDGGRQFNFNITLGLTSNQAARLVVERSNNSTGELFHVYDVHFQPTSLDQSWSVPTPDGGGNGYVMTTQATPTGITNLVQGQTYDPDGGPPVSTIFAYPIPAAAQGASDVPAPFAVTPPLPGFNGQANFLELGVDDDFLIERVQSSDGGVTLESSRSTRTTIGNLVPFGTSTQAHSDPPSVVHADTNVFAMFGSDPSSDGGAYIYKLPDQPASAPPSNLSPVLLPSNMLIAGVAPSTTDSTKVATFVATLVTVPTAGFTLYAGLVDAVHFDGLQLSMLHQGPTYGIHEVPANKSNSAIAGDQLSIVGTSPISTDNGINFVWMDVTGRVLGQAVGDSRLYNTRPGIQATAIAPVQTIAGVLATFFVGWIEERTDTDGAYDVLYVDQVQCAAN
jgi:hypothetical protein